jgi:hypothetical protein
MHSSEAGWRSSCSRFKYCAMHSAIRSPTLNPIGAIGLRATDDDLSDRSGRAEFDPRGPARRLCSCSEASARVVPAICSSRPEAPRAARRFLSPGHQQPSEYVCLSLRRWNRSASRPWKVQLEVFRDALIDASVPIRPIV